MTLLSIICLAQVSIIDFTYATYKQGSYKYGAAVMDDFSEVTGNWQLITQNEQAYLYKGSDTPLMMTIVKSTLNKETGVTEFETKDYANNQTYFIYVFINQEVTDWVKKHRQIIYNV